MNSAIELTPVKPVTCAALVQYYDEILCCHVTNQTHWDLPKGLRDPYETFRMAAYRELKEETGIDVGLPNKLQLICDDKYTSEKDIQLFGYKTTEKYQFLRCTSTFTFKDKEIPEVDDFEWVSLELFVEKRAAKSMRNFLIRNEDVIKRYIYGYV